VDRALVRLLVVNAGSSSLKLSALDDADGLIAEQNIERWDGDDRPLGEFAAGVGSVDVVGHRVVHGGVTFTGAVVVDDAVLGEIRALGALAPLHQPRAVAAIAAARQAVPAAAHVACFDTAFHATLPEAAYTYALPAAWRGRWPLRRFGFHGLSHSYAARRTAELMNRPIGDLQLVSCHLGAGASLCAVRSGRSVDTTMGFTPLDGLVMATRAGAIDPGLVLWLIRSGGLTPQEVQDGLERQSGLTGLAGTPDMREIVARTLAGGDEDARLAFGVYTHQLRRELGAMRAALDRLDACVFTGGVGEHAPVIRGATLLDLDPAANDATTTDGEISAPGAGIRTFVVTAREDLEIARQVRARLA
jgi:acetate kinase